MRHRLAALALLSALVLVPAAPAAAQGCSDRSYYSLCDSADDRARERRAEQRAEERRAQDRLDEQQRRGIERFNCRMATDSSPLC